MQPSVMLAIAVLLALWLWPSTLTPTPPKAPHAAEQACPVYWRLKFDLDEFSQIEISHSYEVQGVAFRLMSNGLEGIHTLVLKDDPADCNVMMIEAVHPLNIVEPNWKEKVATGLQAHDWVSKVLNRCTSNANNTIWCETGKHVGLCFLTAGTVQQQEALKSLIVRSKRDP